MPTFYSEFKVPYCIKITLLNLLSNYLSNQSHKIDSIFHHQLLTYHHDIKMAGILIDENPQIIFITTLELPYEIHFLLKICSMGFSYLSNLIWETLLYEELGHKLGCFQNWILNFRNNRVCHWCQIYDALDHLCLPGYRIPGYCLRVVIQAGQLLLISIS